MQNIIFLSVLAVCGVYYFSLDDTVSKKLEDSNVAKESKKVVQKGITVVNLDDELKSVSKSNTSSKFVKSNISEDIRAIAEEPLSKVYTKNINKARYQGIQGKHQQKAQQKAYYQKMMQKSHAARKNQLKQREMRQKMLAMRTAQQQRIRQQMMQKQNLKHKKMYEQNMQKNISNTKQNLQG